jgi:hypothetical protein
MSLLGIVNTQHARVIQVHVSFSEGGRAIRNYPTLTPSPFHSTVDSLQAEDLTTAVLHYRLMRFADWTLRMQEI